MRPEPQIMRSAVSEPDKRALRILHNAFWGARGWSRDPLSAVPADDFAHARAAGVMFDPLDIDHGGMQRRLLESLRHLSDRIVADAFLASLGSRRLDWRSAFGSFLVFHAMPAHDPGGERQCGTCGYYSSLHVLDLNVLNFERFKWGGVRHCTPEYAMFDLEQFGTEPFPRPTAEDGSIFRSIVNSLAELPPGVTAPRAERVLAPVVKSNKAERVTLLAMLGFAGILRVPEWPGFADAYRTPLQRTLPDHHFVDTPYPACWWRSEYGIDYERVNRFFGHVV